MRLHDVEPSFGPGQWRSVRAVVEELLAGSVAHPGPFLLAIDGRSSNGKSTLAGRIAAHMSGTEVVHTDDIAWWHSRFDWDALLISNVIEPLRRGEDIDYRPPGWDARGRSGSIRVRGDAALVVIEGVGAGRASIATHVDAVIWVQSDLDETEPRNLLRVEAGEIDLEGYEGWMAEEVPFQAAERTWERADLVVSGSSNPEHPATDILVLRA